EEAGAAEARGVDEGEARAKGAGRGVEALGAVEAGDARVADEGGARGGGEALEAVGERAHVDLEHAVALDGEAVGPPADDEVEGGAVAAELGAHGAREVRLVEGPGGDAVDPARAGLAEGAAV